ncbi:AraC family transcriptional regulator [Neobacillus pocheonensis]|uniref:helix-turn-helix transcriptional regulator n=1 Tax=Neobacillus pocheonensis TaxID=363869 RepID=UPI003D2E0F9E
MDELLSKCWLIKNAFHIDVHAVDDQFQTILHISDDNDPLIIVEARKKMYVELQQALEKENKNSLCFHTDSFQLSYMAVAIREEEQFQGMVLVGPFLNEKVTDHLIWNVIKDNHLENNWFKPLETFYKSLDYLAQSYLAIGNLLVNIFVNPLIESQIITLKNRSEHKQSNIQPQDHDLSGSDVKLRYETEKRFLHFVETGDKEQAMKGLRVYSGEFLYRVPGNPLRARKNINFSLNTMLRLAAAKGGVEPPYLHSISEKFAINIESAVTMSELDGLEFSMIEEYCDAVKHFAIKGHSSVVKEALIYIHLHYHEAINLQTVAEKIGYNRSYLAKKFKDEMNISVIDYIQKKRVEEAVFLLEQNQLSITEISYLVGFNSYNYFCKVFKEIKGISATKYKNNKTADE